ncbi:phosphoribosylformylglycinamidine cyclo-ligase [candidate division KSB1 bacterium]|nr:phosphoribosylformylglycinamidine cyclo-ligase [candidate division KSB1 bacterium]
MATTYGSSGVNLKAAEAATQRIAALAKSTFNENVVREIGLFAGFYQLDLKKYRHPVIVSSIDGVGTKLKIAFMLNRHNTVGQDLVNHCVNDIMTCGADPLFFLDYIGVGTLNPEHAEQIISGMAIACKANSCALIGGETAEMPGFYQSGEYDLAGTIIGAVNRDELIDGSDIRPGDVLLGLPSTGLHTNGFSLARKILFEVAPVSLHSTVPELGVSWGEALLTVHRSYQKAIVQVRRMPGLAGISHITGGGIIGNTKRLLRPGMQLKIDWQAWQVPPLFRLLQQLGRVSDVEMRRVFNMGIGLVLIVHRQEKDRIVNSLEQIKETVFEIGTVRKTG